MSVLRRTSDGFNYASIAWRVVATAVSYVVFTCVCLVAALVFSTVVRVWPGATAEKQRVWARALIRRLSWTFVTLIRMLVLLHFSLVDRHRLDTRGELIVSNHPSLVDALYIAAHTPHLCCVVKPALFTNPVTAYLVRAAGYVSNDNPDLLQAAASAIADGDNLLLFPEGTRNTDDTTLDFKRGAAYVALAAECRIRPVTIHYRPRTLQKGSRWYHVPPVAPRVIVRVLRSLDSANYINPTVPVTLSSRHLTRDLRKAYLREFSSTARVDSEPRASKANNDMPVRTTTANSRIR